MSVKTDSEFKQFFWDLALDEKDKRINACHGLLSTLQKKKSGTEKEEYVSYTTERLVKGLGSNRESARQGFAGALCEHIAQNKVDIQSVLELVDKHLMITTSMGGADERDFMFGKLFAFLAVIRSGSLTDKSDDVLTSILDRIFFLHNKRTWIQELTIEAILSLLLSTQSATFLEKALEKLNTNWLTVPAEEKHANHIMFLLGLHHASTVSKAVKAAAVKVLGKDYAWTLDLLEEDAAPLMQTSKKFPQLHKVWDYILGFVAPLSAERDLPSQRLSTLSAETQKSLTQFCAFMSLHLWPGSKEKRALAMKLTVKLFRLVPVEYMPEVLTTQTVKAIVSCRTKAVNMLYDTAGGILEELAASASDSHEARLAMLGVLSQHSGANFDKQTHTSVMSDLIAGLDDVSAQEYLKLLCGVLVNDPVVHDEGTVAVNDDEEQAGSDADAEEEQAEKVSHVRSLIVSMVQLAKTRTYSNHSGILPVAVIAVLLRLTRFTTGRTQPPKASDAKKKTPKKGKKGTPSTADEATSSAVDAEVQFVLDCINIIEDSELCAKIGKEDLDFAVLHLQAGLTDVMLHKAYHGRDEAGAAAALAEKTLKQAYLLKLWSMMALLFKCQVTMRPLTGKSADLEQDGENEEVDMATTMGTIDANICAMYAMLEQFGVAGDKKMLKVAEASFGLVMLSVLHCIVSGDVAISTALETSAALLLVLQQPKGEDAMDHDDDDEEEDPLELRVYEISVDMLSSVAENASRGMREAIKRFWAAYMSVLSEEQVTGPLLDAILGAVIDAEDTAEALEAQAAQEEEVEEEEEEVEPEPVKAQQKPAKKAKADKKAAKVVPQPAQSAEEEEEEEIVIKEDDMIEFLMADDDDLDVGLGMDMAGDDDDDSDAGAIVHGEEADDALINMIKARKESRKQGLLAAKNKHLLLRTRIMDMLEVFVNKVDLGVVLFCMYRPMLLGLRKALKSKVMEQLKVGPSFVHRFETLLVNDLLKKKVQVKLNAGEDEEENASMAEEFVLELQDLIQTLSTLIGDKDVPQIRAAANEVAIATTRIVIGSGHEGAQGAWMDFIGGLVQRFVRERRTEMTPVWVNSLLVERFSGFYLPRLWPVLVEGVASGPVAFTRGAVADMVSAVVKKGKKLEAPIAQAVGQHMGALMEAWASMLTTVLAQSVDKEKDKASAVLKHVKPAIAGAKESLDYVSQVGGSGSRLLAAIAALAVPLQKAKDVVTGHTQQKSSSNIKAIEECIALVEKAKQNVKVVAEEAKACSKKDKKRKADEQAPVAVVEKVEKVEKKLKKAEAAVAAPAVESDPADQKQPKKSKKEGKSKK